MSQTFTGRTVANTINVFEQRCLDNFYELLPINGYLEAEYRKKGATLIVRTKGKLDVKAFQCMGMPRRLKVSDPKEKIASGIVWIMVDFIEKGGLLSRAEEKSQSELIPEERYNVTWTL